jgi:hypothetical protein
MSLFRGDSIFKHKKIVDTKELDKIDTIHEFDNADLEVARSFNLNQIGEYLIKDKFILQG